MPPLSLSSARDIVKRDGATGRTPTVTDAEVDAILAETVRASVWASSTAYVVGDRVVPTVRNGFLYVVTRAGTSGTAEPAAWSTTVGSTMTEGTSSPSLAYEVRYPAPAELYDLRRATYRVWMLKASRASELADVAEDGQSLRRSQIAAQCQEMVLRWRPVSIA